MKIKRRHFLILSSLLGISPYIKAKEFNHFEKSFKKVESTIAAVQKQMFPSGGQLPSSEEMNVISFLFKTAVHKSFDRSTRELIIKGAEEFISRTNGHFLTMTKEEKETAMRAYENTDYGSSWLYSIMTLTMEGLFSDPIYGSNIKERSWKVLRSFGGRPRPSVKYLGIQ